MLLPYLYIAHLEYRERIRDFNVRAARGDFIRYADAQPERFGLVRWIERVSRAARERFSHKERSLVIQPGGDSA